MNNFQTTSQELEKGCGKEISHTIKDVITICGKQPEVFIECAGNLTKDGFKAIQKVVNNKTEYRWELCLECQSKLSQLNADKQIVEQVLDNRINEIECSKENTEESKVRDNIRDFKKLALLEFKERLFGGQK